MAIILNDKQTRKSSNKTGETVWRKLKPRIWMKYHISKCKVLGLVICHHVTHGTEQMEDASSFNLYLIILLIVRSNVLMISNSQALIIFLPQNIYLYTIQT